VLQCVAVCCSVLQCVAVCCSVWQCVVVTHGDDAATSRLKKVRVLQCVAVCCSLWQCVAVTHEDDARTSRLKRIRVLQCVAVCCTDTRRQCNYSLTGKGFCVAVCSHCNTLHHCNTGTLQRTATTHCNSLHHAHLQGFLEGTALWRI